MSKNNTTEKRDMVITRESLRIPRTRSTTTRCLTPQQQETKEEVSTLEIEPPIRQPKCRRQWEQWSEEDQECFFQGLAEHGKDYAKIRIFMQKKRKFKSSDDAKTSEQIRYFYHRTWAKISKTLLLLPEPDPKKACRREMHYMICLGELRKKGVHGLGEKVAKQLDELVTKGSTYVRYKGRNVRVRPPNRFLKKLYRDNNSIPDITLPKCVSIEFLPYSNSAFNYVQKHAFNPRLRFLNVNINAKFSEVFDMFDRRFNDLYTNENLNLLIYPSLPDDIDQNQYEEKLSHAKDIFENKKSETPIVLEDALRSSDKEELPVTEDEDTCCEFPKIFGIKHLNKEPIAHSEPVPESFKGYFTYSTAEKVHLRTLFVAAGQKELLKFKYDWKLFEEKKPSFYVDTLQFLVTLSKAENEKKQTKIKPKANVNPQIKQNPTICAKEQKLVVPGVISNAALNGIRVVNGKEFAIPFRPRPGRKVPISSTQRVNQNRLLIPRVGSNSNSLSNAVAVNLIPQPEQLVQFANLPPESIMLVNSEISKNSLASQVYSSQVGAPVYSFYEQSSTDPYGTINNSSADTQLSYEEVVLDEGFNNQHFKSLSNIITTASALQNDQNKKLNLLQTPSKKASQPVPSSPNLDWLNAESVDLTLTESCFLNVCEMQALQQQKESNCLEMLLNDANSQHSKSLKAMVLHSLVSNDRAVDPVLPMFHNGESSHGPLDGLTFELSNQGEIKPKEHYL
ncbi:uncharacterized protein LOC101240938 isoform X2 [Hydra vulgaris]|uniref:Uncharacterized protein LOC101240938 isoform X2 n=1 Tax=Hydra vulgaris TaxID=6087 RepID=A0ABM4D3B9_HYDVU